jgi:hypothetical protein
MLESTAVFASLLSAALLAGAMFGVWLGFDPEGLDGRTYITVQQQAIRTLNRSMPMLGALTIALTLAAAAAAYAAGERTHAIVRVAAALCFVTAGLITRLLNQPINARVILWSAQAPPAEWTTLRDSWWRFHRIRTLAAILGLGAALAATVTC